MALLILKMAPRRYTYYDKESVTESNVLLWHDIEEIIRIKQKETIIEEHFDTSSQNNFGEDP